MTDHGLVAFRQLNDGKGPVVRINPYEVHINGMEDPDFYEELYVYGSKRKSNKWFWSVCSMYLALVKFHVGNKADENVRSIRPLRIRHS